MTALIWVVIGIGMAAALLFGGTSYFNATSATRTQIKDKTVYAFQGLTGAYRAYVNANGISPTSADWQTQLIPGYTTALKYPADGLTWTFNTDVTHGDYFCLSGSMAKNVYDGITDAATAFPSSSYFVNTSACAARSTSAAPGSWPSTLYITYWLKGS
jgi:hypothetical protein